MKYTEYKLRAALIKDMNIPENWRIPDSYTYLEPFDCSEKRAAMTEWISFKRTMSQAERESKGINPPVFFHLRCLDTLLYGQAQPLVGSRIDEITMLQLTQGVQLILQTLRDRGCDIIIWNDREGIAGPVDDISPYITSDGTIKFSPILYRHEWQKDTLP